MLFPGEDPATDIGPDPGEDYRVLDARTTGRARLDDVDGGAEFLVPVSLGSGSTAPEDTPVIRVVVHEPGWTESGILRSWVALLLLGLLLLAGALVLADRLGRSFVQPIRALAAYAGALGHRPVDRVEPRGPGEVRELSAALERLVARIEVLLERERAGVADLSHRLRTPVTTLRLRIEGVADEAERDRLAADLDELQTLVDHVVREARRSEREGLVASTDGVAVLRERVLFWEPLAEEQNREWSFACDVAGPVLVRASAADLEALVDVLLDNVFTHTPEESPVAVSLGPRTGGGLVLTVDNGGPGFPAGLDVVRRGTSGAGSTGLGLSIVDKTATESGGGLSLGTSPYGGARVVVELGAP